VVSPAPRFAIVLGEMRSSRKGQPLVNASVRLVGADRVTKDSASTDDDGRFTLGPVEPGVYQLQARFIAHRSLSRELLLRAGTIDTVRIRMTYDMTGVIVDCMTVDGRFGSQYCQ
jgi:hypothetical protein